MTGGGFTSTGGGFTSTGGGFTSTGGGFTSTGDGFTSTGDGVALSTGAGLLAVLGVSNGEASVFEERLALALEVALAERALFSFSG